MAREHGLPQVLVDNIHMHHGTGILTYFYRQARAQADDPSTVKESDFRYPGPKPNTREAGVIMLADKVEAATRTLKNPDEKNIRALISRIISSVIADGQFTECPLTLQDIHAMAEAFVVVLNGIYHHRIEYPETMDISRAPASMPPKADPAQAGMITLDLTPSSPDVPIEAATRGKATKAEVRLADEELSDIIDYESLEHLPRGEDDTKDDTR
jgi:hypothetical protein